MVGRLIKHWPLWFPTLCKKFQVTVFVKRLKGLKNLVEELKKALVVEVKWKGQKGISLRRSVKKNLTQIGSLVVDDDDENNGVVEWNQEFQSLCSLSGCKEGVFSNWEVAFTLVNGVNQESKSNIRSIGTVSVNLAEFVSSAEDGALEINVPVKLSNVAMESCPMLCLSLHLVEHRIGQEVTGAVSLSRSSVGCLSVENDVVPVPKKSLFSSMILKDCLPSRRTKKTSKEKNVDGTSSTMSKPLSWDFIVQTDSFDEKSKESKESRKTKKSFGGYVLLYARCAEASSYHAVMADENYDAWIHYSNRISDEEYSSAVDSIVDVPKESSWFIPKQSFKFWRKLTYRSPKVKGEPLLKWYAEVGGDDIDYDRRMFSSSDESMCGISDCSTTSESEFGDDVFIIGSWELKDITSRDEQMKLHTPIFFASIDQRNERAAGESACTALVVVIAHWLLCNKYVMPIKSDFDRLIRDGSLEWRNLCQNETYIEQFPDKHFDLETILEAKVRPLTVVPEKSFIGFFHPEGLEDGEFDFLNDAMSFDSIWEEISRNASEFSKLREPVIYIVSWNDHFFVLEVKDDSYYIVDTLGERLYEGCKQAYAIKFYIDTKIRKLTTETLTSYDENAGHEKVSETNSKETATEATSLASLDRQENKESEEVLYFGKESCKEYIKNFLAAIPIKELQADIKKGLKTSTHLHHKLQIEFHYTRLMSENPVKEATVDTALINFDTSATV